MDTTEGKVALTGDDIGRLVTYCPEFGPEERGRIKSFDNDRRVAFVVYNTLSPNWRNLTGQSTNYSDLKELRVSNTSKT